MAEGSPAPTIHLHERTYSLVGAENGLPRWLTVSLLVHGALIAAMFAVSILPSSRTPIPPVYTVDLVGGERIGRTNFGTELAPLPKSAAKRVEPEPAALPETNKVKLEKALKAESKTAAQEPPEISEKRTKEPAKREAPKESKSETNSEPVTADNVRERLIQAAAERAKDRTELAQKTSKKETLSLGAGDGDGAAALGSGGRGGAGVVKGLDFIIYQNRMLSTIKDNWAWVGQRANLKVVVQFGIKDNGEIVGLKIVQPSGDATYDESVLRAVKKSSPLPAPPNAYRKDFADVELTFRPRDLGA